MEQQEEIDWMSCADVKFRVNTILKSPQLVASDAHSDRALTYGRTQRVFKKTYTKWWNRTNVLLGELWQSIRRHVVAVSYYRYQFYIYNHCSGARKDLILACADRIDWNALQLLWLIMFMCSYSHFPMNFPNFINNLYILITSSDTIWYIRSIANCGKSKILQFFVNFWLVRPII